MLSSGSAQSSLDLVSVPSFSETSYLWELLQGWDHGLMNLCYGVVMESLGSFAVYAPRLSDNSYREYRKMGM